MVMDTLALAVSASANYLLRHQEARRMMLPLVAFPICAVGDLYCIYRELKAVQLRTLNRERGEMITERWLQCQQVGRRRRRIRRHGRGGQGCVQPAAMGGGLRFGAGAVRWSATLLLLPVSRSLGSATRLAQGQAVTAAG